MPNPDTKVTIKIPRQLYQNLQAVIKDTGFDSVTDFIVYCLRDIVYSTKKTDEKKLSTKEADSVKARLKSLGYLD